MAENNRDTENFALGLIVAAILYLLLHNQFSKLARGGSGAGGAGGAGSGGAGGGSGAGGGAGTGAGAGGCGCSGGCGAVAASPTRLPTNPGRSPGVYLGPPSGPITEYAWNGAGVTSYVNN